MEIEPFCWLESVNSEPYLIPQADVVHGQSSCLTEPCIGSKLPNHTLLIL